MNVYICSAARTAIGTYGGTLRDVHSLTAASAAVRIRAHRIPDDTGPCGEKIIFKEALYADNRIF